MAPRAMDSPRRRSPKTPELGVSPTSSSPTKRRGTPPAGARVRPGGMAWPWPSSLGWFPLRRHFLRWSSERLLRNLFRPRRLGPGVISGRGIASIKSGGRGRGLGRGGRFSGGRGLGRGHGVRGGGCGDRSKSPGSGRRAKRAADLSKRAYVPPAPANPLLDVPVIPEAIGEGQYLPQALELNDRLRACYSRLVECYITIEQEVRILKNLKKNDADEDWSVVKDMVSSKLRTINTLLEMYAAEEDVEEDTRSALWALGAVPIDRPARLLHHPEQLL